jgi:hypothetical protein
MPAYTVALVVDPNFGERLCQLASRLHTWAVGTPDNCAVAERLWASEPKSFQSNIERGITTFNPGTDGNPEAWCAAMVGTVDQHHDELSHDPGYTVLEVHGAKFSERLRPHFGELGFTVFEDTDYGFRACKAAP